MKLNLNKFNYQIISNVVIKIGFIFRLGSRCETPMALPFSDECSCLNGGSCQINNSDCLCPPDYTGSRCEHQLCTAQNCIEPFKCLNGKCACPENANCVNPCTSSTCINGGTCHPLKSNSDLYTCQCPPGYNGTNCELDINECDQKNICAHGICVNHPGTYKCYCEPGYTGLLCDLDIDECLSQPCQNSARCLNKVNDYECRCAPGFDGKNCSNDIDECADKPCHKGSTCVNLVANYSCICIPGMTGRTCDTDIDDCEVRIRFRYILFHVIIFNNIFSPFTFIVTTMPTRRTMYRSIGQFRL